MTTAGPGPKSGLAALPIDFVGSFPDPLVRLDPVLPEVAFIGRSNVGKSSLLNALVGRKGLARVSTTPGKTTLLNAFRLPDFYLVDLPGYGFARVAADVQERWERVLSAYLLERQSLVGLVLTVDIRRGLTPLDLQLLAWLKPRALPLIVLLTKADKLSRGAGLAQQHAVGRQLGAGAHLTRFSAIDRQGVDEARGWLTDWLGPAGSEES